MAQLRKTLVRADIAERMRDELGISLRLAQRVTSSVVTQMSKELKRPRGKVKISGFGTFEAVVRKARPGRNFATGETVIAPSRQTVRLLSSRKLKALINRKS